MRLVRRIEKRDHIQSVMQKNTLFIFCISTEKSSMRATEDIPFHGAGNIFKTLSLPWKDLALLAMQCTILNKQLKVNNFVNFFFCFNNIQCFLHTRFWSSVKVILQIPNDMIDLLWLNAIEWLHSSANNGFVFVVGKRKIISGVIFDAESESEIRISLSRQDFEIFEVMCSKNGGFRYFWGYVQGARNFFGFFLECHHLALLSFFKMSYWAVTSDFFSQRYGHIKFWHLSEQPYEHSFRLFGAYHFAFENLSWKFVLAGFDGLSIRIYSQRIDISISKISDSKWRIEIYEIKRFRPLMSIF